MFEFKKIKRGFRENESSDFYKRIKSVKYPVLKLFFSVFCNAFNIAVTIF